ncbi:MAG TPA: translation initiation factor [Allocoleopsis sp.]
MAKITSNPSEIRIIYSEFGNSQDHPALQRPINDLPPSQQNIRIQTSSKGRKGKTVTIISGFQSPPETLQTLLKQLKTQCGTGGTLKDDTLELQGDHKQKLLQIMKDLGYKAKLSGG